MNATTVAAPDRATITAFLTELYRDVQIGVLSLNWRIPRESTGAGRDAVGTEWYHPDQLDRMTDEALRRGETTCVWFGVATRRERLTWGKRGGVKDCLAIPALWVDLDVDGLRVTPDGERASGHGDDAALYPSLDDAYNALMSFPVWPSIVVESGGGLQPYWLLTRPHSLEGSDLLSRWRATWKRHAGNLADAVFNADRIMRLPGSVNHKRGLIPTPVVVAACDNPPIRYSLDELTQHLEPVKTAPAGGSANGHKPKFTTASSWVDQVVADYNARTTWTDVLAGEMEEGDTDETGITYWHVVGAENDTGATTNAKGTDRLVVFSHTARDRTGWRVHGDSDTGLTTSYDRFSAAMVLAAAGDPIDDPSARTEFARKLHTAGYGPIPDDSSWVDGSGVSTGASAAPAVATRLPDEFWTARNRLKQIRQAAHHRRRSADAVLHGVLARVAAFAPHTALLPPVVGSAKPLCYFAAVVARPGVGKGDASNIAAELIPAPQWAIDQVPIGSGEGLVELLFDLVEETDDNGKTRQVKRQVKHNVYVYVDEGRVLGDLAGRSGSTLFPTMCNIWTGGVLGQSNASRERHRVAPRLSYIYGVVIGLQAVKAGAILDDVDGGLPQRFGWSYAADPTIPDAKPDWPGPLDWEPPALTTGGSYFAVDDQVAAEIEARDLIRSRAEDTVADLDGHGDLYRFKVAALLATLDGRWDVTLEDWALAGMIKTASDAVRTNVVGALAYEQNRKEQAARERHARREVEADTATHRTRVVDGARKIADKVWKEPEQWTARRLRNEVARRWRDVFDDALDHAFAENWVTEITEPGQGTDKRSLRPGEKRP